MKGSLVTGLACLALLGGAAYMMMPRTSVCAAAKPIVDDYILEDWGYRSLGTNIVPQSDYEKNMFGEAEVRVQSIKANHAIEGMPGYFCSFVIVEESYPDEAAAIKRKGNLHAHAPEIDTKMNANYVLRDGFRVQNRILFASTQATLFHEVGMPDLLQNLKELTGVFTE
ncbi:MAG: hypothetical protein MI807_01780 [Verrucomicrobiales bacterium]|nr:hypothetical protein [Verrucomicrobiales bacterium]